MRRRRQRRGSRRGAQAAPQRGLVRRRPAALRRRRRHGRRAGGRGRVAPRRRRLPRVSTRPTSSSAEERVEAIVQEANRRIYERRASDASASGMGTTVTAALVEDGRIAIGHVGDSRAYRVRGGELEQLTDDHSLVADLVRSGRLTPEEADTPPAALGDHARARHRPRGRRRHLHGRRRARRHLPALLGRADDDGRPTRTILRIVPRGRRPRRRRRGRSSRRPTARAARTTSPSSSSGSTATRRPRRRGRRAARTDDARGARTSSRTRSTDCRPSGNGWEPVEPRSRSRGRAARAAALAPARSSARSSRWLRRRSCSAARCSGSRARTSSAPRRTATSPCTRASPTTSAAASTLYRVRYVSRSPAAQLSAGGARRALRPRPDALRRARAR